ncbi:MAG TPA: hypothetical protein VIV55_03185 [Flavobacterium sp.]
MKKNYLFAILLAVLFSTNIQAQATDSTAVAKKFSVDVGMDILNCYIWRGVPLDKGPNLQPTILLKYDNLKLGFYGSYSFKYDFNNIMTILSYDFDTKIGILTPSLTHYYYPYDSVGLSDYGSHDDSFSHVTEAGIQYIGKKIPLRVYASVNIANDPEYSTYFEAGYTRDVNGMKVEPFVGFVFNDSPDWHAATKPGLLNIGFNVFKELKIGKDYKLPVTGTLSYHSQLDMMNIMVRFSFF